MNPSRLILLFIALLSITAGSYAQLPIHQGTWSAQGVVDYSYTDNTEADSYLRVGVFSFHPAITYFLSDQFELAFAPDYRYTTIKNKYPFNPGRSSWNYSIGFQTGVRFYFFPAEQYCPFLGASIGVSWLKRHLDPNLGLPQSVVGAEFGVDYFITKSVALEPAVRYSSQRVEVYTTSRVSVGFGVKYFIPQQ